METLAFVAVVRALQDEARRLGLVVPAFRSHPRSGTRAIRRYPETAVVLVALGRDPIDVATDCIDGIVAAQPEALGDAESLIRSALWEAAGVGPRPGITLNLGWCKAAGAGVTVQGDPEVDRKRGGIVLEREG